MGAVAAEDGTSPVKSTTSTDKRLRRSTSPTDSQGDGNVETGEEVNGASPNADGPIRKRRRSRKGLDKRFECSTEGCGKSYSRAEHLYRHQLNHNAKQTYRCEFPDCTRTFVRGDLLKRHMDRHIAKGSQLNRRDSVINHVAQATASGPASPETGRSGQGYMGGQAVGLHYQSPQDGTAAPYSPLSSTTPTGFRNGSVGQALDPYAGENTYNQHLMHQSPHHSPHMNHPQPSMQSRIGSYEVLSPISNQHGFHSVPGSTQQSATFVPQQNVLPFNLPPSQYPQGQNMAARDNTQTYNTNTPVEYRDIPQSQHNEMMMFGQMAIPGTMPVFGNEEAHKSPYVGLPEDFINYLLNTNSPGSAHGDGSPVGQVMHTPYAHYGDLQNSTYSMPYFGGESLAMGYHPAAPQQIMAVNNLLDQNDPEATISEEKSQEIFDFISRRFPDNEDAPEERRRGNMLDGDRSNPEHMLSKRMMQAYIGSYWYHFSDQIPILHKPTFSPDNTPTLLLLAMMTIGAAVLDKSHGPAVTDVGARLSNFLAWQLRWEIFMDGNSRPPAKLWVFQALILLELYEKMYSTRESHERAHIHHATTITLMRRGRSLIGKSVLDSPPNPKEGPNGSQKSSATGAARTPQEWWNDWITNEATRRAAFAAFVVDSIHATMFGHSAFMVAHEMRLPLPCDESLWRATSSAEVGRIESNLMSRGIKPISFLEGLKRTLSHHEVRTNSFGRTVLMAGLLSVTWHMHQRDLQVNVLGGGVVQALGGRDKWRATLTRAYDSWKADFDKALDRTGSSNDPYRYDAAKKGDFNIVFESRTVLHHLAHMAMHADIVDCQMFARAKRLLGRTIGTQEFNSAQRRIKDGWAPSARARDATFYALKFLSSVLASDEPGSAHGKGYSQEEPYEAREDALLNRSWVLYFAALVVWCYGFALEGPSTESVSATATYEEKMQQTRDYLYKYGSITDPNELRTMRGINNNTVLLLVLKGSFESTRWELLHEGSSLLNNCILLNSGETMV